MKVCSTCSSRSAAPSARARGRRCARAVAGLSSGSTLQCASGADLPVRGRCGVVPSARGDAWHSPPLERRSSTTRARGRSSGSGRNAGGGPWPSMRRSSSSRSCPGLMSRRSLSCPAIRSGREIEATCRHAVSPTRSPHAGTSFQSICCAVYRRCRDSAASRFPIAGATFAAACAQSEPRHAPSLSSTTSTHRGQRPTPRRERSDEPERAGSKW